MSQLIAVDGTVSVIDDVQTVAGLRALLGNNLNSLAIYGTSDVMVFNASATDPNPSATAIYATAFAAAQAAAIAAALVANPDANQTPVQTTFQIVGQAVVTAASNFG